MKRNKQVVEQGIERLVGAIWGTTVVADVGGGDSIPDWLKTQIKLERLTACMKPDDGMCTDAEATAYLYTMSLTAPMTEQACRIYFHLCGKYFKQKGGALPPGVPVLETLTPEDQKALGDLKRWIYKQRSEREKQRLKRNV